MPENRERPELFFGLVGAVGTDLEKVANVLCKVLARADYKCEPIRLASLLRDIPRWKDLPVRYIDEYIDKHMDAGDKFREITNRPDALCLMGVSKIKEFRALKGVGARKAVPNQAYIFRSLKHPGEIESLRKIYGSSFYLIAAYRSLHDRRISLAKRIARSRNIFPYDRHFEAADHLIDRDQEETGIENGQNTRDSFHRADLFVDTGDWEAMEHSLARFVELVFGNPFHTPTREEYAMFHARAAALRSSELGRQVGSAIATTNGDIIAVGCNEVAKAGGGLYWVGDFPDNREFRLGIDGIEEQKKDLIAETLGFLKRSGWLNADKTNTATEDLVLQAVDPVNPVIPKDSKIRSLIEFGRAVHGEMAAITDAARRGVSVDGGIMYVTTFPCHLCARHIVAAGISKLIYIEPYAKSLAAELYPDSISVDGEQEGGKQIPFLPFAGIAPRQYMDLFRAGKRKNLDGTIVTFASKSNAPRFTSDEAVYLENEVNALKKLFSAMAENGLREEEGYGGVAKASDGGSGEGI